MDHTADNHSGSKRFEVAPSLDCFPCSHLIDGPYLDKVGAIPKRSRLDLLLSFSLHEGRGQNGLIESRGESAQPLESVKL